MYSVKPHNMQLRVQLQRFAQGEVDTLLPQACSDSAEAPVDEVEVGRLAQHQVPS